MLSILSVVGTILDDPSLIDTVKYYFFLANRHLDAYTYTGSKLKISDVPRGYIARPVYIFENKLLLLYYGYIVRMPGVFSTAYRVSFDIYPERVFKKIYPLDGKIIHFSIDILHSAEAVCSLEFKLDLSAGNKYIAKFISKDSEDRPIGNEYRIAEGEFSDPFIYKMHFEINSQKDTVTLYINKRLINKMSVNHTPEAGIFKMVKFAGSQFQLDNFTIIDFNTDSRIIEESFDKVVNLFNIEDIFFRRKIIAFIIGTSLLLIVGYAFDWVVLFLLRPSRAALLLAFVIPQSLLLLSINRIFSLSIEEGLYIIISIICAKTAYMNFRIS